MSPVTPTGAHLTRARRLLESGLDVDQVSQMLADADAAETEIAWLRRVYSVFEEASPPGDQKAFAERCFDAEAKQCKVNQAWEYLFDNDYTVVLGKTTEGVVTASAFLVWRAHGRYEATGDNRTEAIIRLAAKVAKLTTTTKGA